MTRNKKCWRRLRVEVGRKAALERLVDGGTTRGRRIRQWKGNQVGGLKLTGQTYHDSLSDPHALLRVERHSAPRRIATQNLHYPVQSLAALQGLDKA